MAAQPYIAQWVGEHPKWTAVKWRCEYPAQQPKGLRRRSLVRGLNIACSGSYLLQSFKSLSAIENTASALISMSRTKHCFAPR